MNSTKLKINFQSEQNQPFNLKSSKRHSVLIFNLSCKHFVFLIFRLNSTANWIATYLNAKIARVLSVLKYREFHVANGIVLSVYTNQSNLVHVGAPTISLLKSSDCLTHSRYTLPFVSSPVRWRKTGDTDFMLEPYSCRTWAASLVTSCE